MKRSLVGVCGAIACAAMISCSTNEGRQGGDDNDTSIDTGTDTSTDVSTDTETSTEYIGPTIPETCEDAEIAGTSVGCSFFAVDLNQDDTVDDLPFTIVVSNPQPEWLGSTASVWIEDMRGPSGSLRTIPGMETDLEPGELKAFPLTCAETCPLSSAHIEGTGVLPLSAFRVRSTVPVAVYQWNPYGDGAFTTDASLLLPTASINEEYISVAWNHGPPLATVLRAQVTIVATANDTDIHITPASDVLASGSVPAMQSGSESETITLNSFDVLQIEPSVFDAPLTGTFVRASKPIAVWGGHQCAHVPSNPFGACDHLEEQLLPTSSWGNETVLARYAPRTNVSTSSDQALWRIVAGTDDMTIYFDPPVDGLGITYHFESQGSMLDFLSATNHYVYAELDSPQDPLEPGAPFLAVQYMTGRKFVGGEEYEEGDPFMLLSAPAGQYLNRYVFTTEVEFDFDYDEIIITRGIGAQITLDCLGAIDDAAFTQVGSSAWEVANIRIDDPEETNACEDGSHLIESDTPFGLSVLGTRFANSYAYPGGIATRKINNCIPE